ncbi:hypothetical protein K431DRAFT_268410 [Polychaeton citri CBS 116435]|uniref:Uncharacterized protein n=1 Tax=Polychaeton citri CBS 116435 TaxID=1314669 RepID=A0A9P4Q9D7_9PEZI|nr:hypothetical protein K431DRAFT_268410 [Polychaeton citri CBS 116435]
MAPLPAESALLAKGVTTVELREKGWDDDHITLMQKLAMRGFEPLLPSWNKFGMRFMPDELFSETDDDAFISSARGMHSHSEKALLKLFQMGPNVRTLMKPGGRPEQAFVRGVREYTKWATRDSQLHEPGIIPLVATKARPENTPADILEAKAKRELERLAEMYRLAFTASPSIESPTPTTPPPLAYPLPTLYCLVASHTLVALAAYRCADANPQMHTVAMFDFVDKDYDVWNALAIAIILCHQRNMQIRMSEETGLGTRPPMWDAIQDDPDA